MIVLVEPYRIAGLRRVTILASSPDAGLSRWEGVIKPAQLVGCEFVVFAEAHRRPDGSFISLLPRCHPVGTITTAISTPSLVRA